MECGIVPEFEVFEMPEDLVQPTVAALRVFERSLNPAFLVVLRCGKCGGYGAQPVASRKKDRAFIGVQCTNDECKRTIKFGRPIDFEEATMPARLKHKPDSALEGKVKAEKRWTKLVFDITLEALDE